MLLALPANSCPTIIMPQDKSLCTESCAFKLTRTQCLCHLSPLLLLPTETRVAEEKAEKKRRAEEKKAKAKAEGTYKTKKQKEAEARSKAALEAMAAAGLEVPSGGSGARPLYNNKRKQQPKVCMGSHA